MQEKSPTAFSLTWPWGLVDGLSVQQPGLPLEKNPTCVSRSTLDLSWIRHLECEPRLPHSKADCAARVLHNHAQSRLLPRLL